MKQWSKLTRLFLSGFMIHIIACSSPPIESKSVQDKPPIPLNLLESSIKSLSPEADPEKWLLAHIDVETTGLLPGYHEMIDIGLVLTDLKGKVLDSLFLRIQPTHPYRISTKAAEINAYDSTKWERLGAFRPELAVDSILNFHHKVAGDRPTLMVAFNSHFDLAFLDYLFREAGHSWREMYHYFVLDIPSMAWSLGYRDLHLQRLLEEHQIKDEPHIAEQHTGISGALVNVRIYQKLIEIGNIH